MSRKEKLILTFVSSMVLIFNLSRLIERGHI
jgi:hypothetical protein